MAGNTSDRRLRRNGKATSTKSSEVVFVFAGSDIDALFKRGKIWRHERRIRESAKAGSKTVAKPAEQKGRRELEEGLKNLEDLRQERVRTVREISDEYLASYRLRHPRSNRSTEYAVGHAKRLQGEKMLVDINQEIKEYQDARLREGTAPKSINEEVGFLLRVLRAPGDIVRVWLRKQKLLKLKTRSGVGKTYMPDEKVRLIEHAKKARSPHMYPALTLALNASTRDAETKNLTWSQVNFEKRYLTVGLSKTEAGEGRTIPLNSTLYKALMSYADWCVRSPKSKSSSVSGAADSNRVPATETQLTAHTAPALRGRPEHPWPVPRGARPRSREEHGWWLSSATSSLVATKVKQPLARVPVSVPTQVDRGFTT